MRTLVRARRVYCAFPGDVYSPGAVLIEASRVAWCGPADEAPEAPAVLDLGDSVVLPGFIDAHVHLAFDPGSSPLESAVCDHAAVLDRIRAGAAALLAAGVTTARDLGSPAGLGAAPHSDRLLVSGPPLTTPGGHLHYLGGAVSGAAAARLAVRDQAKAGADWVKLVLSGGEVTPGSRLRDPGLSRAQLRAAAREASRQGLPVAVHAHTVQAARAAIRAGARTIEHCTLLGARSGYASALPRGASRRQLFVTPTANTRWLAGTPAQRKTRARRLAALRKAGVELIAGTDAGIPGVHPGNYADGLVALAQHGVPPAAVLRAATTGAAAALRLPDRGALLPGYTADLVVLAGDPLADIEAVRHVQAI